MAVTKRVDSDRTWPYFCGVAWRRVEALHERARQTLEQGG